MSQFNSTECLRDTQCLIQHEVDIGSVAYYVEKFQLLPSLPQVLQDHAHSPVLPSAHNHPYPLLQTAISEAQHLLDTI